ncbi:MAG TPA: histidine kinase [Pelotomaculum sp.]|nr:histidine kinase [Pelotomaculum sp.]
MEEKILNICSRLFDKLTILKGYLILAKEHKKIDYSLILINEINEIDSLIREIVDTVKNND